MTGYLIFIPVGFLLGSLPAGLAAGWMFKRVDVRDLGSGSTGTSNVLRSVGVPAAVLVLALDMGKAILAVVLARIFADSHGVEVAAALAALCGHNWSIFAGFRGGKGTAPGWGILFILSPVSGLAATLVGVPVVAFTRYMSLGSIVSVTTAAIALVILYLTGHAPFEYVWFGLIGGGLIIARHKGNIQRLLTGQERKLGQSADTRTGQPPADRRKGFRWQRSA